MASHSSLLVINNTIPCRKMPYNEISPSNVFSLEIWVLNSSLCSIYSVCLTSFYVLAEWSTVLMQEWVPAFRKVAPDKLGMRCAGRLNIRPSPLDHFLPENFLLDIGTPVDAWWSDGWWEGVVIGVESCGDDSVHVYFPGMVFNSYCCPVLLGFIQHMLGLFSWN